MKTSNPTNKEVNSISDIDVELVLNDLGELLKEDKHRSPNKVLDKQILAFSYRELKSNDRDCLENKAETSELRFAGTLNTSQWWRRLALPSFVIGGFVMTVLAFQVLWQPLFNNHDNFQEQRLSAEFDEKQKEAHPQVELNISGDNTLASESEQRSARGIRENTSQLALSEFKENQKRPKVDRRVADSQLSDYRAKKELGKGFITIEDKENNSVQQSSLESQNIYTGSELTKSEHPEKEVWFLEIVSFLKKGKKEMALIELKRFRKVYPEYSIDKKIEDLKLD